MSRYLVTVITGMGSQQQLGPVAFMSDARQTMLRHAGLTFLPEEEPGDDAHVLERWRIGDTLYLIHVVERRNLAA